MRYYVIINGVNSLTIKGLAITKMPSIYKPVMRTNIEEIDGRNGDIITELGYGAYNKELTIGLYEDYDIDEIIEYFNQKGTIIFSNEDDKVYNFDIVDQIDFEQLLKFRSATINIHCQPFKYPLSETPVELEYEYIEGEGTNLSLSPTKESSLKIDLKGNTSQTGTPTPSSPIPVNVVSGDNEINISSKNMLSYPETFDETLRGVKVVQNKGIYTISGTTTGQGVFMNNKKVVNHIITDEDYIHLGNDTINSNCAIVLLYSDGSNRSIAFSSIDRIFKLTSDIGKTLTEFWLYCNSGSISINMQIKPMLLKNIDSSINFIEYLGDTYNINLPIENLFDISTITESKYIDGSGNLQNTSNSNTSDYIEVKANQTYCLSWDYTPPLNSTSQREIVLYNSNKAFVTTITLVAETNKHKEFIPTQDGYIRFDYDKKCFDIQLEKGSKQNAFTPYGTTPIELCKIGDYQDYFYKDSGKWYKYGVIKKYKLDSTKTWNYNSVTQGSLFRSANSIIDNVKDDTYSPYSNYYKGISMSQSSNRQNNQFYIQTNLTYLDIIDNRYTSVNDFKTFIENNDVYVYYPLATPTTTEITYQPLIEQLDLLESAISYENQTNISQVNNDLPFILKVKAEKEGSGEGTITNDGNIYSKPIIALEGTGIASIYKDGSQAFQVDMTDVNKITIDTEKLEAYNPDTNVLANRQVIGDYSKFQLDKGANNISISGDIDSATISRYTRWL